MGRKKCDYPLSEFYIYEDEIPANTRISTDEDCEKCYTEGSAFEGCKERPFCLVEEDDMPTPHPCPDE